MLRFDDNNRAIGIENIIDGIGTLRCQTFLDLGATGITVDQSCQLRQTGNAALLVRDVAQVRNTIKWHEMVLTQRVDGDVLDDDHFLVASLELGHKMFPWVLM